ncbi:hypothetical protein [[Clostridium] scindens]|jgi:hypothetical protein|uniref:hypothetical protein n=2 Tax=Clostridium scindens (strain JCM 10418 / VPI 12708) TaxID=29347 RepID=UPI00242CD5C1|nr:hypothetical protein [[Clostridium] scindens]
MHGGNLYDGILQIIEGVLLMSSFELDAKDFGRVLDTVQQFADGSQAEDIINEYLHGEGAEELKEAIKSLLPVSGRTWRGKEAAAKSADPFRQTNGNLSVKIHTKGAYHYLYFPDDGSDTDRHYGNQQFMFRGAEEKSQDIVNTMIDKMLRRLEE